jgi:hypothetical protein
MQASHPLRKTKSSAKVVDSDRNRSVFVLTHVICNSKIIAKLKQMVNLMNTMSIMNISTILIKIIAP